MLRIDSIITDLKESIEDFAHELILIQEKQKKLELIIENLEKKQKNRRWTVNLEKIFISIK